MAVARTEAPLNTNDFVMWREDLVSELMLHNLDHYLSHYLRQIMKIRQIM